MKIAFYAPLKPPTHPSPSGDRKMARLLMHALRGAGHDVELASQFRSWEGHGDLHRQLRLRRVGERLQQRLIRRYQKRDQSARPDIWFTYHLYHKAPDWLGPGVCRELGLPYLVAEASHASKQENGRWADGYRASTDALSRASAVIALNRADIPGIEPLLTSSTELVYLKPFQEIVPTCNGTAREMARQQLAGELSADPTVVWMLTVGMMRAGAKLSSYRLLAWALRRIVDCDWRLIVVGDGVCRSEVENAFQDMRHKVIFAGLRAAEEFPCFHAAADMFVWPAIDEAYGMAILEAQSAGLPVVAGSCGGVPDIVRDEMTGLLVPEGDTNRFAEATKRLLNDQNRRRVMGQKAGQLMAREHDIGSASRVLGQVVSRVSGL